jgi:hypothetical protein
MTLLKVIQRVVLEDFPIIHQARHLSELPTGVSHYPKINCPIRHLPYSSFRGFPIGSILVLGHVISGHRSDWVTGIEGEANHIVPECHRRDSGERD